MGAQTPPKERCTRKTAKVANAIVHAYAARPGSNPAVAVRSSATAEDLPEASFAGHQETYLNVSGASAVLDATRKCRASLWTARAIGYRARQNIGADGVALAVVVQNLVPAKAAGILFTANPVNGQREQMVISASCRIISNRASVQRSTIRLWQACSRNRGITMRIALGGITHEANTFCPHVTDMADFEARQLVRGDEILDNWQSTRTEQAGALSVLTEVPECHVIPTLLARALSGAPMRRETFSSLSNELLERVRAACPVDGVLLVLHGAMMAEHEPDATGAILERLRAVVGPDVPIVGTLDLHANVTKRMVREATALIGYHTAPHVDMYETGQKVAQVLVATIQGRLSPTAALVRLPMLLPPENSTHNWGPLARVIDKALEMERAGAIVHGGIYPVQPWMDTEDVAASVVVITDGDAGAARSHAQELALAFWAQRSAFVSELVPPDEAVGRALSRESGTVILCDSADATTSGSTGDSTVILGALLRAAPFGEMALANVVDQQAVAQAIEAGVGATVTVQVGGHLAPGYFEPVAFTGYVKTISDGTFTFKGPGMRGVPHHMGRTVVLVRDGIYLVVMERGVSQWDPQLYRCLGQEPTDARIVQVKSPMAFRAAYEDILDEVIVVTAAGAASPDLVSLPWQHLPRPIYPLDPDITWP